MPKLMTAFATVALALTTTTAIATAAPTLTVDRACAISIPVEPQLEGGNGDAFLHGTGFGAHGGVFDYTSLPTGAGAAPSPASMNHYFAAEADPSGTIGEDGMLPPRVEVGTRPQVLPGVATIVGADFDTLVPSNAVSFPVAVPGAIVAKHAKAGAAVRVRAFGLGILDGTAVPTAAFALVMQQGIVVSDTKLAAPRSACAVVSSSFRAPKRPGSYVVVISGLRHPHPNEIDTSSEFVSKLTVRR